MSDIRDNPELAQIVNKAIILAKEKKHIYITTEHFLLSMALYQPMYDCLEAYGVDVEALSLELEKYLDTRDSISIDTTADISPRKTNTLNKVITRAVAHVLFNNKDMVEPIDILVKIIQETSCYASFILRKYGIALERLDDFIAHYTLTYVSGSSNHTDMLTDEHANKILEKYCTNLNAEAIARRIDPVIGRQNELDEIAKVLAKRQKCNILMVGDPGVGKTAIAEGLARKIVKGNVPDYLREWIVYNLDVGSIVAGSKYRGQFEEKLRDIIDALEHHGQAILFIDEIHQVKGAGAGGSNEGVDFANMLKPAIAKGKIKVIGSTTWEEYIKHFEKDRALARRFQLLVIDEPSIAVAKDILRGIKKYFEKHHEGKISDEAIIEAVELSHRYQTDKKLPDKAIDLMDTACAQKRLDKAVDWTVSKVDIMTEISKATKIPLDQFTTEKSEQVVNMEERIKDRLFGQDEAIKTVLNAVYVAKAGLKEDDKPIGSFIFTGPTGTGKTELCKLLSETLSMKLLRYDMSEYQEKHSISRLIGAPPGYVGYDDSNLKGGLLISDIRENPNAIVLFDEFEKADSDVLNVILQMMDNGKATGSNGNEANCTNTIIVMTSNVGAEANEKNVPGFARNIERTGEDEVELKKLLRPEFRNRVDAICKFNQLDELILPKIVDKFIKELNILTKGKAITVRVDDEMSKHLAEVGFDRKMGARPLKRKINELIKLPLSKKILFENVPNSCKIIVGWEDDKATFEIIKNIEVEDDDQLSTKGTRNGIETLMEDFDGKT